MKKLIITLFLLAALPALAQRGGSVSPQKNLWPDCTSADESKINVASGNCPAENYFCLSTTGDTYKCSNRAWSKVATPTGGGGSALVLQFDGTTASSGMSKINIANDNTPSIFSESPVDGLLIDVSANWPTCDSADAVGNNAVTMATDTVGNYVATIDDAGNTTITVANSGSENADVTLDAIDLNCSNCLDAAEINTGAVATAEILDNTITATDLSATLTFADDDLIDLSAINGSDEAEGLILPQAAVCSTAIAEGQLCWDSDNDILYAGDGLAVVDVNGSGSGTITNVFDCASGNCQSITMTDGTDLLDMSGISVTAGTEGLVLPIHATDCSGATTDGQVCWQQSDDTLWIGDGVSGPTQVGAGGSSEWTDTTTTLTMNETGDDVAIGAALINGAKLSVDADADQVQFSIQCDATQTDSCVIIEDDTDGNEVINLEKDGDIKAQSIQDIDTGSSTWKIDSSGNATLASITVPASGTPSIDMEDSTYDDSDLDVQIAIEDDSSHNVKLDFYVERATTPEIWFQLNTIADDFTLGHANTADGTIKTDTLTLGNTNAFTALTVDAGASDPVLTFGSDSLALANVGTFSFDEGGASDPTFTFADNSIAITNAATFTVDGSAFQMLDTELTLLAGLAETTGNVIISVGSAWASVAEPIIDLTNATDVPGADITASTIPAGSYVGNSIDGDDINSNLAGVGLAWIAGGPDQMDIDTDIRTRTETIIIQDPATADSGDVGVSLDGAGTVIVKVWCSTDSGSVDIDLEERAETTPDTAGTDVLSAELVCDTNSQSSCSAGCDVDTITNSTIDQYDLVNLQINDLNATTPGVLRVHVEYTIND